MSGEAYLRAVQVARNWARGQHPSPIRLGNAKQARVGVGVYLCCDELGQLRYIGSAVRPSVRNGVGERIHEHSALRRSHWRWVWIVPLHDDTPKGVVEAIEGRLIAAFNPPDNRRRHRPRAIPLRPADGVVHRSGNAAALQSC